MASEKITNGGMTPEEGETYTIVTINVGEMSLCTDREESNGCRLEHYLPAEAAYLDHIDRYGKTKYTEMIKGTLITAREFSGLKLEDKL